MRTSFRFSSLCLAALLLTFSGAGLLTLAGATMAQDEAASTQDNGDSPSDPKVLTVEDYGRWSRIRSADLSPDGEWMAYSVAPNEGDGTLHVLNLADEEKSFEVREGSGVTFSDDSQWMVYSGRQQENGGQENARGRRGRGQTTPDTAQRGRRGRGGGPSGPRRMVLRNLATEAETDWAGATAVNFTDDSQYLTIRKSRAGGDAGHSGSDLVLYNLQTEAARNFGSVSAFSFNDAGNLMAYVVDAADGHGNGVYLFEMETGVVRPLDTSRQSYSQLTWNESGTHLAVMRGETPEGKQHRENTVLAYRSMTAGNPTRIEFDAATNDAFPEGMILADAGGLRWSEDANMLFIGIRAQQEENEAGGAQPGGRGGAQAGARGGGNGGNDDQANVDVWHWKDESVQSVQQRRAGAEARRTIPCVIHINDNRFVQLGDDAMDSVSIVGDGRWGIGRDNSLYAGEITWGGSRADYYRVDLQNGARTLITQALGRAMGTSPDGRYYLYLKGGQVLVYDLDHGTSRNLSLSTRVNFVDEDDDHPYEKPAYGVAGWTSDGQSVILNHKFDLWALPLDGTTGRCLTAGVGEREQIRFRYRSMDPEEETIDLNQPMMLSAYGEWTKKSGFYSLSNGEEPQPLVFDDVSFGTPTKAKDSDAVLITRQTFVDYPDYYLTNTQFDEFRRLTEANPQQAEYAWGPKRVLVDYENADGVRLQGTLTLPAGYEEGKQYPMLVYFYELMSNRHHQYSFPAFDDRPHMSTYASDGYLVLMPDVIYTPGRPGDCAVDCVTSAVQKVIDLGYADPDHIALQGHSWGGYQSSFILTQTDMFCSVVTGAPVTNLVSFYNELYKSSGNVQQGITERGQVRMGTTPWENMELFHSQSPLHNVRNITTPFIILHGTDDGSVDWHQGLEYYNAAKRNGKEVILLSYPGEGHHLGRKANQIDFQVRMKQFFDHYCKGAPAPKWMTDGVPFLEKETASPTEGGDLPK